MRCQEENHPCKAHKNGWKQCNIVIKDEKGREREQRFYHGANKKLRGVLTVKNPGAVRKSSRLSSQNSTKRSYIETDEEDGSSKRMRQENETDQKSVFDILMETLTDRMKRRKKPFNVEDRQGLAVLVK